MSEVNHLKVIDGKSKIIVAMDVTNLTLAAGVLLTLQNEVGRFKLGLELIFSILADVLTGGGKGLDPIALKSLNEYRHLLILDAKLLDIPNTLQGTTDQIRRIEPAMFMVHASAGIEAMKKVAVRRGKADVLAVTVLTSHGEEDCQHIYGAPCRAKVLEFAHDALIAGVQGLICSPQDLSILTQRPELDTLLKVCPGVRPEWAAVGDQRRVMTPREAILAGADYLVIGRPIINPPKEVGTPVEAARRIAQEIQEALLEKGAQ